MSRPTRVRFAPSPTGYLHVGGARTALFNWLYARQTGGVFVLRIEDTDEARNTEEARQTILRGLGWVGLDPDEGPEQGGDVGPYYQSERSDLYASAVADLKSRGGLYACFCSKADLDAARAREKAEKRKRQADPCRSLDPSTANDRIDAGETCTWRFKVPEGETVVRDLIHGEKVIQNQDVDDFIAVRSDGTAVYNLAVVVDDHHMGITHVLRGQDHYTNTTKQVLLFHALGWEPPTFAHLPLILGPEGEGKLSKRRHPEAALEHYIARGYHPDAMVNWLARLGWSYDGTTEIMNRQELIERFSIERVNKAGARLPLEKLRNLSGEYIRRMSLDDLVAELSTCFQRSGLVATPPTEEELRKLRELARVEQPRMSTFSEPVERDSWAFRPVAERDSKATKNLEKDPETPRRLRAYADRLPDPLPSASELESQARTLVKELGVGFGKLVHPVRAALTGSATGPPLFDCIAILGRATVVERLGNVAAELESQAKRLAEG